MDRDIRRVTELQVRREALGKSRRRLAIDLEMAFPKANGLKQRTVERWEDFDHEPCDALEPVLCDYFGVGSVALLGLGKPFEAARWRTWMTPEEMTVETLHRRTMLHRMGAAGATFLLLPVCDLVAGAQLLDAQSQIGTGQLALARRTATTLATAYAATPDADAVQAAKAHAYTLLDRLAHATMSEEIDMRLRAVASDAAALAGYGETNAGRLDQAARWFDAAVTLARQVGDRRLEALALVGSAYLPYHALDGDQAAVVAGLEAAAELHPFLPPAARAYVFASLARERAGLGDDLGSGRFLEHAGVAAAYIPYDEPGWGWWSTYGELSGWEAGPRPKVYAGRRSLALGRPDEALALFDEALDGTALPVRRSHLHQAVMDSCVSLDDPDRACASGVAALDEARAHEVGVVVPKVRKVRQGFPEQWSGLAAVIELDERLALAR